MSQLGRERWMRGRSGIRAAACGALAFAAGALGSCKIDSEEDTPEETGDTATAESESGTDTEDSTPPTAASECWSNHAPNGPGYGETLAAHEGACFLTARYVETCDAAVEFSVSYGETWDKSRFDANGDPVTRCAGSDVPLPCPDGATPDSAYQVCTGSREQCVVADSYQSPGCIPDAVSDPGPEAEVCELAAWVPGGAPLLSDREATLRHRCYGRATCTSPEGAERVVILDPSGSFEGGPPRVVDVYDAVSGERVARWQGATGSLTCAGGTWSGPAHPDCYGAPFERSAACGVASLP